MKVSVIVPCCNGEAFLAPTLNSVLNQTLLPAEVIVVDDGSTDGSLDLARSYDGIVRTLSGAYGGASAARNAGVAVAEGDAIMFLDADDLLGPTVLQELTAVLSRHPGAIASCPWYRLEEVEGCWLTRPPSCAPRRPGQDDLSAWLTGWYHPPCSLLWSRSAYERSGGWDPKVRVNTDGDVMMRGLIRGNALVPTREGTAYYRRLPGDKVSLSGARTTRTGVESRIMVIDRIARMLEESGRLSRYRAALGEAYDAIAESCRDLHPDLYQHCRSAARAHAGPPWLRRARSIPASRLGPAYDRASRYLSGAFGPTASAGDKEGAARSREHRARPKMGNGGQPLISVVIPTYNRADLLPRALNSVLAQSYERFEVLVVDDGSTDRTPDVLASYDDDRIRYLQQPENRGVGAARNRGLREARGDFIAFLDSDDEWLPDKLALQAALFAARSERVGLVYTGVESVLGERARSIELPVHRGDVYGDMLLKNVLHGGGSNVMVRRSVVDTVGLFDERLPAIEDYDYWLRITRFFEVDFVEQPLVRYYDQMDIASPQDGHRRSLNFEANMTARRRFYERYRHEMQRAGVEHLFLLDSARRHLGSPFGSTRAARRLVLQALLRRPTAYAPYPMLLPDAVRRVLGPAVRNLRALAATAGMNAGEQQVRGNSR